MFLRPLVCPSPYRRERIRTIAKGRAQGLPIGQRHRLPSSIGELVRGGIMGEPASGLTRLGEGSACLSILPEASRGSVSIGTNAEGIMYSGSLSPR